MKKLVFFILFSIAITGSHLYAMDFIVGAKAGYFVWVPYFQEMKGSGIEELETGSGVLYGPAVSIIINDDISFSGVMLYGKQSTYWKNDQTPKNFGSDNIVSTGTFYSEIQRVDVDSVLSYRFAEQLKLFIGYKYQYTETKIRGSFMASNDGDSNYEVVNIGDVTMDVPSHGPALGIGYSLTLGQNFFASVNFSGLYMFSKQKYEKNRWVTYTVSGGEISYFSTMDASGIEFDTKQVGINIEPSAGIMISDIVTTVGLRLQWMRTKFVDEPEIGGVHFAPSGWLDDYLYGLFIGVLYKL